MEVGEDVVEVQRQPGDVEDDDDEKEQRDRLLPGAVLVEPLALRWLADGTAQPQLTGDLAVGGRCDDHRHDVLGAEGRQGHMTLDGVRRRFRVDDAASRRRVEEQLNVPHLVGVINDVIKISTGFATMTDQDTTRQRRFTVQQSCRFLAQKVIG